MILHVSIKKSVKFLLSSEKKNNLKDFPDGSGIGIQHYFSSRKKLNNSFPQTGQEERFKKVLDLIYHYDENSEFRDVKINYSSRTLHSMVLIAAISLIVICSPLFLLLRNYNQSEALAQRQSLVRKGYGIATFVVGDVFLKKA